jgi:radical SAM protein with 4Fe4S-binding SPASM domain
VKRFRRIYLELTNACNIACPFCPENNRPVRNISLSELNAVIPQISVCTDEIRPHLLGEPLVYPYFEEFCRLCEDYSLAVKVTTNGLLLDEKHSKLLRSGCIKEINFSLQSYYPQTHGSEESYVASLIDFSESQETLSQGIYINYRIWNLDNGIIPASHKILLSLILQHYNKTSVLPDIGVRSLRLSDRRRISFDNRFEWPSLKHPIRSVTGRCHGTVSHIGILSDGSVVPCCLDSQGTIVLGKIFEKPLSEIADSMRLTAMTDGFNNGQCVEELCKRCTFIKRFE